jgi:hypothetical protein
MRRKDALFLGVPGWLGESPSLSFSSTSFTSAGPVYPLLTRRDLPAEVCLFPTSGQLSASSTGGGCGRGSLREEGVVPVLGLDADDAPDAPLRTDGEVGIFPLAETGKSGCREPEEVEEGSRVGDGIRGTCDWVMGGRDWGGRGCERVCALCWIL